MIKKSNIFSFIGVFSWKFICDFLYNETFYNFKYYGTELSINNFKIFESYLVILICFFLFIYTKISNLTFLLIVLFTFQLIPLSTYYSFADQNELFFRTIYVCFISFLFVNNYFRFKQKILIKKYFNLKFLIFFGFIILFFLIYFNGLPSSDSFNLYNVYSRRSNFVTYPFAERLNSILTYVISPILFLYGLKTKNKKILFISILFTGMFFLISGGKYALFLLALLPIFYFIYDKNVVSISLFRMSFFISLACAFLFIVSYDNLAFKYLFNQFYFRTFITPAWLSFVYFDVFQIEEFYYFSETLGFLNQKTITVPELVGDYLFGDQGGSFASNGFFGDAYANLGVSGIIIISVIFNIIIMILNSIKKNNFLIKILPVYIAINGFFLINSSLLSLISSRGLIIGVFLIMMIKEFKSINETSHKFN